MVEEANARLDLVAPTAFHHQLQRNFGLGCLALDSAAAHDPLLRRHRLLLCHHAFSHPISFSASTMAVIACFIWARVPTVTRTQPLHPWSFERSRVSTPRRCIACTNSLC